MGMSDRRLETATLGGGCFWCLEAVFELLEGVETVTSGASGGHLVNPTYQDLCSGLSGHAEVVNIEFDPTVTSYREILEVFFATHDPTTLDRQGADVGPQYRSVILSHSPEQKETVDTVIDDLTREGVWKNPIVTEVVPFEVFYPAEDYHQGYYRRNGRQPYCRLVIDPKVAKLRSVFDHKLREKNRDS